MLMKETNQPGSSFYVVVIYRIFIFDNLISKESLLIELFLY